MEEFNPRFERVSIYPLERNARIKKLLEETVIKFIRYLDDHYRKDQSYKKHFRVSLLEGLNLDKDLDKELIYDIKKCSKLYLDLSLEYEKSDSDEYFGQMCVNSVKTISIGLSDGGSIFFPAYKIAEAKYIITDNLDDMVSTKSIDISFI